MRNYFTVFKLLFKYLFKRGGLKSSKVMIIPYAIVGVAIAAMIAGLSYLVYTITPVFAALGRAPEFLSMIVGIGSFVVLIFGLIPMLNYLYFSRDTEFFLGLPVKPSTVFLAKLSVVYLTEIIFSTAFLVPILITAGVALSMNAFYYIILLPVVLLSPSVFMTIAALLAIPLMYIVSFFKNKGALTSIVLILIFGLFFVGYYALTLNMGSFEDVTTNEELLLSLAGALGTVGNVLMPFTAATRLMTLSPVTLFGEFPIAAAALINLSLFVLSCVVLVTAAGFISAAVYRRGAASTQEGGSAKNAGKIEFKKSGSALSALFKKEWKELVRTPAFAFQSLSGVILCPVLVVSMSIMGLGGGDATLGNSIMWFTLVAMIMILGIGTNIGAATCMTREGKTFYYSKLLPVDYKTQVKAKLYLYLLVSSIAVIASLILLNIFAFDPINTLFALLFLLPYNYGFTCMCILIDLSRPKLNWVTPQEAVKNNRNAVLPTFANMGVGFVLMILPLVLLTVFPAHLTVISYSCWGLFIAIGITCAALFHRLLNKNAERYFLRIEL